MNALLFLLVAALTYRVVRRGYCRHCGERLDDNDNAQRRYARRFCASCGGNNG